MNGAQKFQIHRDDRSTDRLPAAHTCFNQLDLPAYEVSPAKWCIVSKDLGASGFLSITLINCIWSFPQTDYIISEILFLFCRLTTNWEPTCWKPSRNVRKDLDSLSGCSCDFQLLSKIPMGDSFRIIGEIVINSRKVVSYILASFSTKAFVYAHYLISYVRVKNK